MRRRPADPQRTRSVLMFCAAVSFGLAMLVAGAAIVEPVGSFLFGQTRTGGLTKAVLAALVALVLAGLGVACLRLAQDDGRGTWCPECVARNPEGATTCESCGARLD